MWFRHRHSQQAKIAAVLDAGSHKICCLIARILAREHSGAVLSPARIQLLGYALQRSEGIRAGSIVDMGAAEAVIRQTIAKAEKMADMVVDRIFVTAAGGQQSSQNLTARVRLRSGQVEERDIEQAIDAARHHAREEGRIALHTRAVDFAISGQTGIRDPRGMVGDELAVGLHSITAEPLPVANFKRCMERGHIALAGFGASAYVSALGVIAPEEAENGVTVIDMGGGVTSVSVFVEGQIAYTSSVNCGGNDITSDLVKVFDLSHSDAERLKTLYGSVLAEPSETGSNILMPTHTENGSERWLSLPKPELCAIIRRRQESIFVAIAEKLAKAGFKAELGRRIILAGGGSQLVGAAPLAQRILGRPARPGSPLAMFNGPAPDIGPAYAAAAGLLAYCHSDEWAIDLNPPKRQAAKSNSYLARVGDWLWQGF